jgi:hypothetical protein
MHISPAKYLSQARRHFEEIIEQFNTPPLARDKDPTEVYYELAFVTY